MPPGGGVVPTGYAEETFLSEHTFRTAQQALIKNQEPPSKKRKREEKGDASTVYGAGAYKGPWAKFEETRPDADEEEDGEDVEYVYEEDEIEEQPAAPSNKAGTEYGADDQQEETTEFNGSQMYDYQGRTYMHIPNDLDIDLRGDIEGLKDYHPKNVIHTWKSHTKAITQLRFFPDSGHLLLSASADGKIKLFDTYHDRELLRTYNGHKKSANDICFDNDGMHFLTASFDRTMKLWDTETGKCISRFSTGKTPHVLRFNPDPAMNHEFLAGMSDKKIVQFDTRKAGTSSADTKAEGKSEAVVQEYDHHLGPVNTITYCDENKRFITTSDDKSLRAWEYGIPVPIKTIAEPDMFPLVRSAAHPSGKYALMQSADNRILVYATTDRFRQNRKKEFRGHNNAGYAIDVAVSADGGIVASGDTGGYACFWDFKTCKMWHKMKISDSAVVSCQWHPRETSKVVTGDLNGVIKYLD